MDLTQLETFRIVDDSHLRMRDATQDECRKYLVTISPPNMKFGLNDKNEIIRLYIYNNSGKLFHKCDLDHNGVKHGEFVDYYETGKISSHGYYHHGTLVGRYQAWRQDEKLACTCYYNEGKLHGQYQGVNIFGEVNNCTYDNGVKVSN